MSSTEGKADEVSGVDVEAGPACEVTSETDKDERERKDKDDAGNGNNSGTAANINSLLNEEEFTKIVGLVEDIFVGEGFQTKHTEYFTEHCHLFSDDLDENQPKSSAELEQLSKEKFNVFRNYSVDMASFLETELKRSLGDQFEIDVFIQEVEARTQRAEAFAKEKAASSGESPPGSPPRGSPRENESAAAVDPQLIGIDGEIFETLLTLKDYARFQELMVDFLKMKQGKMPDMDGLVSLRKISDDEAESV